MIGTPVASRAWHNDRFATRLPMSLPTSPASALDRHARPLRNLRVSVTDRCNLRCAYCMPEEEYAWLAKDRILTFEEISRLVDAFASVGVDRVRLTGGEPLLRRDLDRLVALIAAKPAIRDIAMTTNAITLPDHAAALRAAGLGRLTISLDTLDAERYRALTRRDDLSRALAGVDAARDAGFTGTKLNTVVMRGVNDDELARLLAFGRERSIEVRFIEYMDVGGATHWSMDKVVSRTEMLERIASDMGAVETLETEGTGTSAAPADRYRLADGTVFGIIASTTRPFCGTCDRSRLTCDGQWYLCLYAAKGIDLAGPLRAGASSDELAARILGRWVERDDRGAEARLAAPRTPLDVSELRDDPHLEMHTRGG